MTDAYPPQTFCKSPRPMALKQGKVKKDTNQENLRCHRVKATEQLPANGCSDKAGYGSSIWGFCLPFGTPGWSFQLLASAWLTFSCYGHWGQKPMQERFLSLLLSSIPVRVEDFFLCVNLPFNQKLINLKNKRYSFPSYRS